MLNKISNFKEFLSNELKKIIRVLKVATKPSQKEFFFIAKISIIGISILGIFGLIVSLVFSVIDLL
ncbi:MAG: protein translocase SEC61 complex subunit gamma [Candidatus Anstonellaceae archaeon]